MPSAVPVSNPSAIDPLDSFVKAPQAVATVDAKPSLLGMTREKLAQALRGVGDQQVSLGVAIPIVDSAQVVQAHQQQAEGALFAVAARNSGVQRQSHAVA